jgi:preprotein translocase subunit YajC
VLITPAYAQAAGAASQSDTLLTFLPMIAVFAVFYFMLIRPQQKKAKESRAMLDSLEKGNEIVTSGGVVGRITRLTDQYAVVEVASGVEMTVQRGAISQLLPKGTIKGI